MGHKGHSPQEGWRRMTTHSVVGHGVDSCLVAVELGVEPCIHVGVLGRDRAGGCRSRRRWGGYRGGRDVRETRGATGQRHDKRAENHKPDSRGSTGSHPERHPSVHHLRSLVVHIIRHRCEECVVPPARLTTSSGGPASATRCGQVGWVDHAPEPLTGVVQPAWVMAGSDPRIGQDFSNGGVNSPSRWAWWPSRPDQWSRAKP